MVSSTMSSNDPRDDAVEFDAETGTYRTRYGPGFKPAGLAVVEVVAAAEDTDSLSLDPLGNTVDVEALNAMVESLTDDLDHVSLSYHGYRVSIGADGFVELDASDSPAST